MKRIFILCFSLALCLNAWSWGKVGHAVVAQVATNHLSPKAKQAMEKYLNGKTLVEVASYGDTYRAVWTLDLGFFPTNPDDARVTWLKGFDFSTPTNISPISHSVTVYNDNFKPAKTDQDKGRYVNNCAYYLNNFAKELKHAEKMDSTKRFRELCWIIHLIGDMHCPQHIVYMPQDSVKGHFNITYKGKKMLYHAFWDRTAVEEKSPAKDIPAYAKMIDTSSEKEIKAICKGNIFDWVKQDAEAAWAAHCYRTEGDVLPDDAAQKFKPLTYSQLRNGGYRLAEFLNRIFK